MRDNLTEHRSCQENLAGPIRIPDHPLVRETIDNCLREAMDVDRLREILEAIQAGGLLKDRGAVNAGERGQQTPERGIGVVRLSANCRQGLRQ